MDGASRCTGTTGGQHDYIPDPPGPYDRIRTATCRHCGDVLTATR